MTAVVHIRLWVPREVEVGGDAWEESNIYKDSGYVREHWFYLRASRIAIVNINFWNQSINYTKKRKEVIII